MAKSSLKLKYRPLTPDLWDDFEALFGVRGACGGCWCMLWRRTPSAFKNGKGAGNRAAMQAVVNAGREPGILAFAEKTPVGWCAVAPRDEYPGLGRSRVLKAVDTVAVWSVSCLFVMKEYRRRGVSVGLLKAAIDFVAKRGGSVVEGYPVEPKTPTLPPPFAWTGIASAFLRAGFTEHRRGSASRPIMRYTISQ